MKEKLRKGAAVFLCGLWINVSEFFRNEILLKTYWVEHYRSLGMTFPSAPVNGVFWILWGFLFAGVIYVVTRRFRWMQAALFCWFTAFVLMWLVIFNLNVLPLSILAFAVPLSLLEAVGGAWICLRVSPRPPL